MMKIFKFVYSDSNSIYYDKQKIITTNLFVYVILDIMALIALSAAAYNKEIAENIYSKIFKSFSVTGNISLYFLVT